MQNNPYSAYTDREFNNLQARYSELEQERESARTAGDTSKHEWCNRQREMIAAAMVTYTNR